MADIDIGSTASDRDLTGVFGWTRINQENPANATGTITSIEIWANTDLSNCKVATFFNVSGTNFTTRDTEVIGSVTAGSKQYFGVNLDVQLGDYIGCFFTAGDIERDTADEAGTWAIESDQIPCTNITFTVYANQAISLYGTGTTAVGNAIFFGSNF